MKKTGIINAPISNVIEHLEHTEMLTVANAGLPVPSITEPIDLALKSGVPSFLETLEVVLIEMHIERAYGSEDILAKSPHIEDGIKKLLGNAPGTAIIRDVVGEPLTPHPRPLPPGGEKSFLWFFGAEQRQKTTKVSLPRP